MPEELNAAIRHCNKSRLRRVNPRECLAQVTLALECLQDAFSRCHSIDPSLMESIQSTLGTTLAGIEAISSSEQGLAECDRLMDRAFKSPSSRLVAYGTLRPGECNHSIVSDIAGDWIEGSVSGFVEQFRGYPRLRLSKSGRPVAVSVLVSDSLPVNFDRIDNFEGEAYIRILAPVATERGLQISNVYAASDQALDWH